MSTLFRCRSGGREGPPKVAGIDFEKQLNTALVCQPRSLLAPALSVLVKDQKTADRLTEIKDQPTWLTLHISPELLKKEEKVAAGRQRRSRGARGVPGGWLNGGAGTGGGKIGLAGHRRIGLN